PGDGVLQALAAHGAGTAVAARALLAGVAGGWALTLSAEEERQVLALACGPVGPRPVGGRPPPAPLRRVWHRVGRGLLGVPLLGAVAGAGAGGEHAEHVEKPADGLAVLGEAGGAAAAGAAGGCLAGARAGARRGPEPRCCSAGMGPSGVRLSQSRSISRRRAELLGVRRCATCAAPAGVLGWWWPGPGGGCPAVARRDGLA